MPLKQLPIELHTMIFDLVRFAEMDSDAHAYRTTYSLCLVSRNFYSMVVPVMYRTLLIDGRKKASLLSRTLRCRPELGDRAVHLFLSDRTRQARSPADDDALEVLPVFAFEYPGSREGRLERLQRMQLWMNARAQTLAAFRSVVQHILGRSLLANPSFARYVVSPHLQVLSLCMYGHYDGVADSGLADALTRPFPTLVELTVRDNVQPDACTQLTMPKLERLHLAGGNPPHPFVALGGLEGGCPRLTHVRLSEPFLNDVVVDVLELLLSPRSESGGRRISDTLERLILEPSPYLLVSPAVGDPQAAGTTPSEAFGRLAALAARSRVLELVSPPSLLGGPKREDRYSFDDALHDWTDCVMGRPGCWRSSRSGSSS